MENIPRPNTPFWYNTHTYHIPEATWSSFIDDLSFSRNVTNTAMQDESFWEGTMYKIRNIGSQGCSTLSEQNRDFVESVLREILLFALAKYDGEPRYMDSNKNQYVAKKENGFVTLIKIPHSPNWPWSDPCVDTEIPCFKFSISDLHDGLHTPGSNTKFAALLLANERVIYQLANHIVEDAHQTFPSSLVKSAKCYLWQSQRDNFGHPPSFGIVVSPIKNHSQTLKDFLFSGKLPKSDQQKCELAWELMMWESEQRNFKVSEYLAYIFRDLDHLDFTSVSLKHYEDFDSTAFSSLCNFVAQNFEGKSISFNGIRLSNLRSRGCIKFCVNGVEITDEAQISHALHMLIKCNPNIRSLSFYNSPAISNILDTPPILAAIANNQFITKLEFVKCELTNEHAGCLAKVLVNNSTLTELNLHVRYFGTEGILALIESTKIKSLNVRISYFSQLSWWVASERERESNKLLTAIHNNKFLTSFSTNWFNDIQSAQCNQYVERNRQLEYSSKIALFEQRNQDLYLPHELIRLIFALGINAITEIS